MSDFREIRKQSAFCMELMQKLDVDIKASGESCGMMEYHSRKQDDIRRLRRELMVLSNLLKIWG